MTSFDRLSLDILGVGVATGFLLYASLKDVKTREVPDGVWLLFGPVGLLLTFIRTTQEPKSLQIVLLSIGLLGALAYGLFYFGLYGGADAKAALCLAIMFPVNPEGAVARFGFYHPAFALTVLYNSFFAIIPLVVYNLARNIVFKTLKGPLFRGLEREPLSLKLLAVLSGYKESLRKLSDSIYLYPLEHMSERDGRVSRRLKALPRLDVEPREEIQELISALQELESSEFLWVTPALPMLVFITVGFLLTILFGDLVMSTEFAILALLRP